MRLPSHVVQFLVDVQGEFTERYLLLDLFSEVEGRPVCRVPATIMTQLKQGSVDLGIEALAWCADTLRDGPWPQVVACHDGDDPPLAFLQLLSPDKYRLGLFPAGGAPLRFADVFQLQPTHIANFPAGEKPFDTTVGQFFFNSLLYAGIFGDKIPYLRSPDDVYAAGKYIGEELDGKIPISEYKHFLDYAGALSSFAMLCVPTGSAKSYTTHPDMKARKRELLEKYAGRLDDIEVAKIIEDTCQEMDAEWLKGDISEGFYQPLGAKIREVGRRKMIGCVGIIPDLSKDTGRWVFIPNALTEGWDKKDLPAVFNELRKGSYSRGVETQFAGAMTKLITRIFQTVEITEDDCGTTKTLLVDLTPGLAKRLLGRSVRVDNRWVEITKANHSQFVGPTRVRGPMTCQTKNGYCYACCGKGLKRRGIQGIGTLIPQISTTLMYIAMKEMHGTKVAMLDIGPEFSRFVING